jgi:hypothetical protein
MFYKFKLNSSFKNSFNSMENDLRDKLEIKVLFGIIMVALCLITSVGNICVIYRYRKASMVVHICLKFNHLKIF